MQPLKTHTHVITLFTHRHAYTHTHAEGSSHICPFIQRWSTPITTPPGPRHSLSTQRLMRVQAPGEKGWSLQSRKGQTHTNMQIHRRHLMVIIIISNICWCCSFPGSSGSKESACKAGDPGSISGLGRSPGEGIGYPLQYPWASLVTQMVKNPPAVRETLVRSLQSEEPLQEGMATQSSILAWRIPIDRGAWRATVHGVTNSQTWLRN